MAQSVIRKIYPVSTMGHIALIHEEAYVGYLFRFKDMQYETLYYKFMKAAPTGSKISIELITPASPLYANYGENTVVVTVAPQLEATAVITATATSVVQGESVEFGANGANIGFFPVYDWRVNGQHVGEDSAIFSYVPADKDEVVCIITPSVASVVSSPVVSNGITMEVIPDVVELVADIFIIAEALTIPAGGVANCFIDHMENEGDAPTFQWYVDGGPAGGGTSDHISVMAQDQSQIYCEMTSNHPNVPIKTVVSNTLTITVLS